MKISIDLFLFRHIFNKIDFYYCGCRRLMFCRLVCHAIFVLYDK